MVLPLPTVTVWAGSRATMVYEEGAVPIRAIRCSRSRRTRSPSTVAPASRHRARASSQRNSTPTSSTTSIEASCTTCTWLSDSRSTQGIRRSSSGSQERVLERRLAVRASRPRRTRPSSGSTEVSVIGVPGRISLGDAPHDRTEMQGRHGLLRVVTAARLRPCLTPPLPIRSVLGAELSATCGLRTSVEFWLAPWRQWSWLT